jgi:hypothetical protein
LRDHFGGNEADEPEQGAREQCGGPFPSGYGMRGGEWRRAQDDLQAASGRAGEDPALREGRRKDSRWGGVLRSG